MRWLTIGAYDLKILCLSLARTGPDQAFALQFFQKNPARPATCGAMFSNLRKGEAVMRADIR
jgi:hypothetical protein